MLPFLARRLLFGVAVLVLLSLGTCWFFTAHFYQPGSPVPGDPWRTWWGWITGLVLHGSVGSSPLGQGLWSAYDPAIVHTAILLVCAFALVILVSLVIGTVSAVRAGSALDVTLRWLAYATWGMPAFLVGLILQHVLAIAYGDHGAQPLALSHWPGACPIPLTGGFYNGACKAPGGLAYALDLVQHLTLPSFALALSFIGIHARYLRSSLLVTLQAPYTTTARAKGLPERRVIRHALRNSLIAFASALLLDFGSIFGASMAVDYVFQLGGIGSAFLGAIASPTIDPITVTFLIVITGSLVLLTSIATDVLVSWLDPRVQLR